jgi:hypothetical protein
VVIIGGVDRAHKPSCHTQCYDIATNRWSLLTPLPRAICYAHAFASPGGIGIVCSLEYARFGTASTGPSLLYHLDNKGGQYYRLPWTLPIKCDDHFSLIQLDDSTLVVFGTHEKPISPDSRFHGATNSDFIGYALKQQPMTSHSKGSHHGRGGVGAVQEHDRSAQIWQTIQVPSFARHNTDFATPCIIHVNTSNDDSNDGDGRVSGVDSMKDESGGKYTTKLNKVTFTGGRRKIRKYLTRTHPLCV